MDDGRGTAGDADEPRAGAEPAEYDQLLLLERLESLEEEMEELDVASLDELRRRIAELHRRLDEEG